MLGRFFLLLFAGNFITLFSAVLFLKKTKPTPSHDASVCYTKRLCSASVCSCFVPGVYPLASVNLPPCHLVALQMSRSVRRAGLSSRATATCTSLSARPGRLPSSAAGTSTPIWSASSRPKSSTLSTVSPS